ncbi:hypothetical protein RMCBS344292_06375 [Rhizopus microsporus]|nr:hypothetical protein RMCBS344292_06375 [Rhizopus microsporus]
MFQHGASDKEKIETYMYPPEYEDFAGEASRLDIWVFDHVKELFKNASTNPELDNMLRQKKIVFFLHLLGLDTNGHGFRPSSKEYLENIKLVDSGIREIVNLIEDFYQDGKTSYIFTADHGMNNRGAHGDGHPDNTRTPIVAWGAGIRQPIHSGLGHDEYSSEWGLSTLQRDDILQADIAPLMAHLIGIDIPVNSVGELPLNYLNANGSTKAEAAFTNARQILEQLRVKHNEKEQHELFFRPYPGLVGQHDPTLLTSEIKRLITDKDYELAEKKSKELIELCLRGLRYYQTYDWLFLRTIITIGYVGWCIFCLEFVIRHFVLFSNEEMSGYLKYRIVVGSYFHREVLSAIFIGLSAWPCVMPSYVRQEKGKLTTAWSLFCIFTSVFTLLPVEKGESIEQVIAGGAVAIIMGTWMLWKLDKLNRVTKKQKIIIYIQLCMIAGSMAIVYSTSISLKNREGLPELNQIASWCIIAISSVFPFVYRGSSHDDYLSRLLVICLAFTPLMTLLSISYELLFYVFFCSTVLLWMEIERSLYKYSRYSVVRALKPSDGRAAVLFMFFVNVAFFGTGNVASLSSFSLESVYRFTTVFNPFLMGALLILKILIPFFVISSVLGIISSSLDLQPFTLFLIVMSITDIQTINFFYFVTDYGSWLEIGTSISHFCISELFIIFTIILFLLSRTLVGHLALPKLKRIVDRMKPKSK